MEDKRCKMGEIAVFLGKLGVFLCIISLPIIFRAFLQPIKVSFIEGFFYFKLLNLETIKETMGQIKERLNSKNVDSFYEKLKFWFLHILLLFSFFIILCAYICLYVGLCCLI